MPWTTPSCRTTLDPLENESAMAKRVLGVGHACLDQILIWKDGNLPVQDNQLLQYDIQGGGMVATALVTVARLGGEAEFWGVLGDDPLGEHILHGLRMEGVNVDHVLKLKGKEGPVAVVCVDAKTGERRFYSGKPIRDPVEVFGDLKRVEGFGCVLVDGYRFESAYPVAQKAHQLGIPVVGDVEKVNQATSGLIDKMDYAIASVEYAQSVGLGGDLEAACKSLYEQGAKIAVLTCGKDGLIVYDGTSLEKLKSFQVDVVDTTGAGDTFHGAFCFGLLKGLELRENLLFSSAAAAMKCRRIGGRAGIPLLNEVAAFLKESDHSIERIT